MMTDEERADILADDGYRYVEIDGELYRADRVAWLYVTGEWPEGEVEHINGDRGDNRWENLRLKEQAERHDF
jgi:HNH endonuclease